MLLGRFPIMFRNGLQDEIKGYHPNVSECYN
jgi:hypothetical protein